MRSSLKFDRHMSLQIDTLRLFGLSYYIPHPTRSLRFWLSILVKLFVGVFGFLIYTAAQIAYLVCLLRSGNWNIVEVTGIVNLVATELCAELRLLDMRLRRDRLSQLLVQMNSEEFQWPFHPQREICEKAIRLSRGLFVALFIGASVDVFVHAVVVPAAKKFDTLPIKMDFILFDVNDPRYYNYVCAYQILWKPYMVAMFAIHQSLPWAAMSFTMSQLDVLIYNFENMKELVKSTKSERNCEESEAFRQIFKKLIIHYSSIIRFVGALQNTFGGQLSGYLFVSAFVSGTTALQLISIESPSENFIDVVWILLYLTIFVMMLFLDCYFGNSITKKCEQLSNCVFACPWTEVSDDLKKSVIIFIAKTQQPVVITAMKLVPVSLESFTKVMNWTYKGFAVMNQMK